MHQDELAITGSNPVQTLRRFAQERPRTERCELCCIDLQPRHYHLIELANRRLLCACQACAVLFSDSQNSRYRRVPQRIQRLPDFRLTDEQWDNLQLPIGLAFFCRHSRTQRIVAQYPSPAGAMESQLDLGPWDALVADNPILSVFEPDVEALLVNRMEQVRLYYRTPIDECYRLVGLVRLHWKGFSGGPEFRAAVEGFFNELQKQSR